jgi:hypothetical protein
MVVHHSPSTFASTIYCVSAAQDHPYMPFALDGLVFKRESKSRRDLLAESGLALYCHNTIQYGIQYNTQYTFRPMTHLRQHQHQNNPTSKQSRTQRAEVQSRSLLITFLPCPSKSIVALIMRQKPGAKDEYKTCHR